MYVSVAVCRPLFQLFSYAIPPQLSVSAGVRVKVPFGRQTLVGIVVRCMDKPDFSAPKMIHEVIDEEPLIEKDLMDLALWMSSYYVTPLGEILFAMFPPDLKSKKLFYEDDILTIDGLEKEVSEWKAQNKRKKILIDILTFFEKEGGLAPSDLKKNFSTSQLSGRIKFLLEKGLVKIKTPEHQVKTFDHDLSVEQSTTYAEVCLNSFQGYLLHGVTGSGKTEVYLRLIADVLKAGGSALVLIPEISLTDHLLDYFDKYFSKTVVPLHSHLSDSERAKAWWRIKHGEKRVVLGSRSAVFAPMKDLGIIIVDEEHESTYKQEESPRYHGRDVAVMRAMKANIPALLGSATPSLESYYNVEKEKYRLLKMTSRVGEAQYPKSFLVDMRYDAKKKFFLSRALFEKICTRLDRKEQVILFLNKRGATSALLCESCGVPEKCICCDVSLTYHSFSQKMRCHYCDYTQKVKWECSKCQKPLKNLGFGTQFLEKEIQQIFPRAKVARLDTDVAAKKGQMSMILSDLKRRKIDILVGTQMIAKGLDVHGVTLVGVIYADMGLFVPDFRSAEKSFQVVSQVAGRAGRGKNPGEVVIQTYNPDHIALKCALKGDFETFYKSEMRERQMLSYSPYTKLVEILFRGKNEKAVEKASMRVFDCLKKTTSNRSKIDILGPAPMPISKINNQYRWHILLKFLNQADLRLSISKIQNFDMSRTRVQMWINVDPFMMM
ncbi:primosomal protein N' [PVC group bacterium (ex Bugula neritina AB1)]|nr:primosomal protein N' [PVC group bacterium (ex Bugula neritina AB1)]